MNCLLSPIRPEDELLICVSRPSLAVARIEQLHSLLRRELDWEYLLTSAHNHSLIPLLHFHIRSMAAEAVPAHALSQLQSDNQRNTKHSLLLTGELLKQLAFLEASGVKAIPFKGPVLAVTAYGDLTLRQFSDLDILVHKQDFPRVKQLLITRGFRPNPELTKNQEAALLRFDCARNFDNEKGVVLDVHWSFTPRYFSLQWETNRLWDRLASITIGNRQLPSLSCEDLLLSLCLHGFTHFWERLGWICDVAGLIDRNSIDWKLVLQSAGELGSQRIVSVGLLLANRLLGTELPGEVVRMIRSDGTAVAIAERFQQKLFAQKNESRSLLQSAMLHASMRERMRDRFRSCVCLATTPRVFDWMSISVPDHLFFLYYPLRPIRLAGKYATKLMQRPGSRRRSNTDFQPSNPRFP